MDVLSRSQRSENMRRIRGKHTRPERVIRAIIRNLGLRYRYRLHPRNLPGSPDIVIGPLKCAIFVHGCFWHRHARCRNSVMPKSNVEFWRKKLEGNVVRDAAAVKLLKKANWRVLVVWECETRKAQESLVKRVGIFLRKAIASSPDIQ